MAVIMERKSDEVCEVKPTRQEFHTDLIKSTQKINPIGTPSKNSKYFWIQSSISIY